MINCLNSRLLLLRFNSQLYWEQYNLLVSCICIYWAPSAITRLTAQWTLFLICWFGNLAMTDVITDTECLYWDQVSLTNKNSHSNTVLLYTIKTNLRCLCANHSRLFIIDLIGASMNAMNDVGVAYFFKLSKLLFCCIHKVDRGCLFTQYLNIHL